MGSGRVRVEIAGHVAEVVLSRPDKHNALDGAMFEGILAAAREVAAAPGVRAVVLHGEGKSFCAGLDVAALGTGLKIDDILERAPGQRANAAQRVCTDWIDLPVPVIAALHGNVLGGGLQIALGADVRIAAADARLSIMESRWGLVPDMGITATLPRLVAIDVAKELTYTARVIAGEEAARLGLVSRIAADPLGAARALAAEIAGRSPDAVRSAKRLLDTAWHAPVEEGLVLETELQRELIGSANQVAAVTAGMTGQAPEFVDPGPVAAG
ncbi:MAG: crotonase/enoyl-CoA hydratase family protein [Solirubrobacterales bacterium]|nr:crotonase/enoyl-CoA hydratase family protein [Solirubrobacterales bacterium]